MDEVVMISQDPWKEMFNLLLGFGNDIESEMVSQDENEGLQCTQMWINYSNVKSWSEMVEERQLLAHTVLIQRGSIIWAQPSGLAAFKEPLSLTHSIPRGIIKLFFIFIKCWLAVCHRAASALCVWLKWLKRAFLFGFLHQYAGTAVCQKVNVTCQINLPPILWVNNHPVKKGAPHVVTFVATVVTATYHHFMHTKWIQTEKQSCSGSEKLFTLCPERLELVRRALP